MTIKIYMEDIEQAIMEYVEKQTGIPCDELEKYPQKLYNSGYRTLTIGEPIDSRYVTTTGDLKCALVEIEMPGIDITVNE